MQDYNFRSKSDISKYLTVLDAQKKWFIKFTNLPIISPVNLWVNCLSPMPVYRGFDTLKICLHKLIYFWR